MSEPTFTPASEKSPQAKAARPRGLLVVSIIGGTLLLLVALALILFIGLQRLFSPGEEANPGIPLEVVRLTPTVDTSPLPPPATCETIISSGDVEVAVSLPVSLTVNGEPFPIIAVVPGEGAWSYPADRSGAAAWLCGTVINYVLALEPTPENGALLTALKPGDALGLHLSNDVELSFRFIERRETSPDETSALEQKRPRLTLILDQGGARQIATADYADIEPIEPPSSETLAYPGQAVRVADARVIVIKGHVERNGPDLSPGTMYYLVEFSVENVGAAPLDANALTMQLKDSMENSYLFAPTASAAGEYGPLSGLIEPGATVQGTAGYLVPDPLVGPTLLWTFASQPGSEAQATVSIPYETEVEVAPAAHAEVTLDSAPFLSGDRLIIGGEIRNTGGQPLTVELADIKLTSSAGLGDLQSAAPPLPWTIQPGQSQVIELQYIKPDASSVLLDLLGYSFAIDGL